MTWQRLIKARHWRNEIANETSKLMRNVAQKVKSNIAMLPARKEREKSKLSSSSCFECHVTLPVITDGNFECKPFSQKYSLSNIFSRRNYSPTIVFFTVALRPRVKTRASIKTQLHNSLLMRLFVNWMFYGLGAQLTQKRKVWKVPRWFVSCFLRAPKITTTKAPAWVRVHFPGPFLLFLSDSQQQRAQLYTESPLPMRQIAGILPEHFYIIFYATTENMFKDFSVRHFAVLFMPFTIPSKGCGEDEHSCHSSSGGIDNECSIWSASICRLTESSALTHIQASISPTSLLISPSEKRFIMIKVYIRLITNGRKKSWGMNVHNTESSINITSFARRER